jgi:hypothetical protein
MSDLPYQPVQDFTGPLTGQARAAADINATNIGAAQTQAQTGLVNQQTIGAALQNQKTSMMLGLYKQQIDAMQKRAVNDQSPLGETSGVAQTSMLGSHAGGVAAHPQAIPTDGSGDPTLIDAGLDPAHIAHTAEQNYAVKDTWTPDELQAIEQNNMGRVLGMPDFGASIKMQHDARIASMTGKAQLGASDIYDKMYAVSSSPHPLQQLELISPEMADAIRKAQERNGWTDAQANSYAKTYADEVGNAVHKYSGREVEVGKDGIARDKPTQQPLTGAVPEGLSAKDWTDLSKAGEVMVPKTINGRETQVPQWQADGYSSKTQWINAQLHHGAAPTGGPAAGAAPAPTAPTATTSGTAPAPTAPTATTSGAAPAPVAPAATASGAAPTPAGKIAPLRPEQVQFIASGPNVSAVATGNTGSGKPNPADTATQTDYVKARTGLLADADEMTQTAQSSLTNVKRIESIMAKDPVTGPGAGTLASVQTFFQSMTGKQAAEAIESNPALYQLLGKELSQDQLNSILTKFHGEGAQVRLGAQESKLILGAMSANPELSKGAIQQMVAWEKTDSQYNLDKARTARAWVNAGKDPQQFNSMYEDAFPRPTQVGTTLGATPPKTVTTAAGQKLPQTNAKGWVLHTDKQGRQAYVSPDGKTYEVVK